MTYKIEPYWIWLKRADPRLLEALTEDERTMIQAALALTMRVTATHHLEPLFKKFGPTMVDFTDEELAEIDREWARRFIEAEPEKYRSSIERTYLSTR
jgi:hypothetical protein